MTNGIESITYMAEEEHHAHGLAHGHHAEEGHKDKDRATYWALGLSAVGVLLAVLVLSGGGSKKSKPGTNTVVQESRPFIPNPTDVSIGSMAAPLYWPALPTSGTPNHPKTHHSGDKDHDNDKLEKHHSHTKPNDHKGYGKSPTGASHGHTVTHHTHNPVVTHGSQHTKGKQNG